METKWLGINCDFCSQIPPEWRYDLPPRTPLLGTFDPSTGKADMLYTATGMGACGECRKILKAKVLPEKRLARRVFNLNPTLSGLRGAGGKRARKALVDLYQRILPQLANERPWQHEDPTDGFMFSHDGSPGPERN